MGQEVELTLSSAKCSSFRFAQKKSIKCFWKNSENVNDFEDG